MNKIILLGLALILVGCQSTNNVEKEASEDMKVAEVALMNGKPESAMDLYRNLLV